MNIYIYIYISNTYHPSPKPQKQRRAPSCDALNETHATQLEAQRLSKTRYIFSTNHSIADT